MITGPLGLYRPRNTVLHRALPGAKLLGLVAVSVLIVVLRGPWWTLGLCGVLIGVACIARLPSRSTLMALRPMLIVAVAIAGFQTWQRGWEVGVEIGVDLLALVLAATIVTATTRTDVLLDGLVSVIGLFDRKKQHQETVSLVIALMLSGIPTLMRVVGEAREAARARGARRSSVQVFVPSVVRTVAHAERVAEAIVARGLLDTLETSTTHSASR